MNTNFENYRTFYFVAKYGNITAAAEALYSEQPNVTRAIKNLERDLGCVLFARSNKGVTLTPEGEILYRRVAIAYEQIAAAEEELSRHNGFEEGLLRIGVSETALHEVLLSALVRYHALYPKIKFSLVNLTNTQAIGAVKNQAVDFVLISTPFSLDKSLKSVPIKRFQDIVVCGERYRYLTGEKVSFRELTGLCILPHAVPPLRAGIRARNRGFHLQSDSAHREKQFGHRLYPGFVRRKRNRERRGFSAGNRGGNHSARGLPDKARRLFAVRRSQGIRASA